MAGEIEKVSTGVSGLDSHIDSLYIGDNVVWEVESGLQYEIYIDSFVERSLLDGQNVIYISFNSSPQTMIRRFSGFEHCRAGENFFLVDGFSLGKGRGDSAFMSFYSGGQVPGVYKLDMPGDPAELIELLRQWEGPQYYGARYVFDSLTGMQELWKDSDLVQDFFTYMCPRLFDLNTIAYWTLERNAHPDDFKANIRHITQVVLELFREGEEFMLKPLKLSRRRSNRHFRKMSYEVTEEGIRLQEALEGRKVRMGGTIRDARVAAGLSQKDFARSIGMTPSYVSQMENDQLLPSLPAFLEICRELNLEPGSLVGDFLNRGPDPVVRRGRILADTLASTGDYSVFSVWCEDRMSAVLMQVRAGVRVTGILELLGCQRAGACVLDGKVMISTGTEGSLSAAQGDFLPLGDGSSIDSFGPAVDALSAELLLIYCRDSDKSSG